MRIFIWSVRMNSGGPEALHQLADSCTRQGFDARLCYRDQADEIAPFFACYRNINLASEIPDEKDCVVVLPEICTNLVATFQRAQVVFWWLSVHNNKGSFTDFQNPRVVHAYQSHFARAYIEGRGCTRCHPLFDYINDSYQVEPSSGAERLNLVVFNPNKGFELTRHFVAPLCRNFGLVPLTHLSRQQVRQLLLLSKLYIDFGPHPGKDRLPREAALLGNCALVARRGAARNAEDVPIPDDYKIDTHFDPDRRLGRLDLNTCLERIAEIVNNYDRHVRKFEPYVQRIRGEKAEFDRQVVELFGQLASSP